MFEVNITEIINLFNASANYTKFEVAQIIAQKIFWFPLGLLFLVPTVLIFLFGAATGSLGRKNFWRIFVIPIFVNLLIFILIMAGLIPIW